MRKPITIVKQVVLTAVLTFAALVLTGCGDNQPAVNDISPLNVSFNEDSNSYALRWQAMDQQQPVSIAIARGGESYLVLAKNIKSG